jgi:hypothetical protein
MVAIMMHSQKKGTKFFILLIRGLKKNKLNLTRDISQSIHFSTNQIAQKCLNSFRPMTSLENK